MRVPTIPLAACSASTGTAYRNAMRKSVSPCWTTCVCVSAWVGGTLAKDSAAATQTESRERMTGRMGDSSFIWPDEQDRWQVLHVRNPLSQPAPNQRYTPVPCATASRKKGELLSPILARPQASGYLSIV